MTVISSALGDALRDRYLLERELGAGGMATVYLAQDLKHDRKVAIKLVRPATRGGSLGGGRMRLLREAQAMAKLSHPNVVAVHDVGMVGTVDEQVFVAMEFIDGTSLRVWLQAATRSWSEVLERFRQAGRGLAAAHAHDLIHRARCPVTVIPERALSASGEGRLVATAG